MFRKRTKRVPVDLVNAWEASVRRAESDKWRARPNTIDEYLALSPSERCGAFLQASLITDLCESVAALRAGQETDEPAP